MNENEKLKIIQDEEKFPYENMSLEDRNYYLNIIRHCKDICDSKHKVDGCSRCDIVEMRLVKNKRNIHLNGSLSIGDENKEYRWIDGDIYLGSEKIIVDMVITRSCVSNDFKMYTVLDEFTKSGSMIKRRSQYNYDMESICEYVPLEQMKGRLK